MIDIGLTKIALIGVVALVVIGPEKLPRVARMAGSLFGRAQRYISDVKQEVSREIDLEEFRNMQNEVREAASTVEQSIHQNASEVRDAVSGGGWNDDFAGLHNPLVEPPTPDQHAAKAKNFRKKKLARTSAVPSWFKRQNGRKSRVISGAARVARYRPAGSRQSTNSFH
jgi:sec-independent protein translocase protein TatB